jgi:hypothetical protein
VSVEETNSGTNSAFTQIQYGAFVTKSNGVKGFVATSFDPEDAIRKARDYYQTMAEYPQNNMDFTDLDRIEIKQRVVSYSAWEAVK